MNLKTRALALVAVASTALVCSSADAADAADYAIQSQSGKADSTGAISFRAFDTSLGEFSHANMTYSIVFDSDVSITPTGYYPGDSGRVVGTIATIFGGTRVNANWGSSGLISLEGITPGETYNKTLSFAVEPEVMFRTLPYFQSGQSKLTFSFEGRDVDWLSPGSQTTFSNTVLRSAKATLNYYYTPASATSIAAVPESATWTMLLVGFGMIAGASRYRRRSGDTVFA